MVCLGSLKLEKEMQLPAVSATPNPFTFTHPIYQLQTIVAILLVLTCIENIN